MTNLKSLFFGLSRKTIENYKSQEYVERELKRIKEHPSLEHSESWGRYLWTTPVQRRDGAVLGGMFRLAAEEIANSRQVPRPPRESRWGFSL